MKQRKNLVTLILALVLVGAVVFPAMRAVVAAQPGDAADPLVTRRYVDERIDTLWTEIQALRNENALLRNMVEAGGLPGLPGGTPWDMQALTAAVFADVMLSFEAIYGDMLRQATGEGEERSLEFVSINTRNGQTLTLENGTEAILRTGAAVVVAGPNGLVDMTAGRDIENGAVVRHNHLLIAPRSDGRGMRFTAESSWVMVRGAFTLE
ncbi:MAG: hypothetical protein FWB88_07180 [Defluviitaleaceae bacterium]|nr:hypothetical protein [Defluviitaleaceae bacterium]MCL2239353.1 hypothetical protein [Defluviitaleaceae bacterium]